MSAADGPIFVKLGGSLITDKTRPRTVRRGVLHRLARELAAFWRAHPGQPLLLGHGSGSFGHWAAREHGWQPGRAADPAALGAIARTAADLHQQVMDALHAAGLPVWSFPPSATALARQGRVVHWDQTPLVRALEQGWIPVVYGDVVLDETQGGVILSTEEVFAALVPRLRPTRLLLLGLEPGVWRDWPQRTARWAHLTPRAWRAAQAAARGAAGPDVTGGMAGKVQRMLDLVQAHPELEVRIFSGLEPDALRRALEGAALGTLITADGVAPAP